MKKYLITLVMLFTLGAGIGVTAQNGPKDPTELTDSASKDELEAFSDTTQTAGTTTVVSQGHRIGGVSGNGISLLEDIFGKNAGEGLFGIMAGMLIVAMICFLLPIIIFALLLYFIFKNRREKMKLAQMAMQQGQPIPQELLKETHETEQDTYQSGMRQLFLGIGLMVFLGYTAGKVGFGIGALVFFIGLGKVIIARTSGNGRNGGDSPFGNNSNNPSNIQNYG